MSFRRGIKEMLRGGLKLPAYLFFFFFFSGLGYAAFLLYISPGRNAAPLPAGLPAVKISSFTDPSRFYSGGNGSMSVRRASLFQPFSKVARFKVAGPSPQAYSVQLNLPTAFPVGKGDLLAARFYLRRPLFSPAAARADLVFEEAGGGYNKSISLPAEAGLRWRRVEASFRSAGDYPAGKASVNFRLGFGPQEIELAGFELVNFGKRPVKVSLAAAGYEGREKGAPWRVEAERRIENLRKGGILIRVTDSAGRPLSGVKLQLRQVRHAFSFGAAISSKYLYARNREDNKARYRKLFLKLFNTATIENDLKWPYWFGERKGWADKTTAWLKANKISLRGHTLVWPGWRHMPDGMEPLKRDPEKLRAAIRGHITEEAAYFKGSVRDWDVLNEPLDNSEITSLLGPAEMAEWFKLARQADPSAKLYINECAILSDLGSNTARQDAFEKLVLSLLEHGAPLDAIGLQSHFDLDLTPPARLISLLDRFQKLGKPLYATELDISASDEKLQADYLRDFMTAMFSHPAVEGITLWTFWEGVHSAPLPALYRKDWKRKPAAEVLEALLLKEWRTELSGVSGSGGEFTGRGFYGAYEIEAVLGKSRKAVNAVVSKDGGSINIVLEAAKK